MRKQNVDRAWKYCAQILGESDQVTAKLLLTIMLCMTLIVVASVIMALRYGMLIGCAS